MAMTTVLTLIDHSGFRFPWLHDSTGHDVHHEKFIINYGAAGWLDYLLSTDYESLISNKKLKD
jgi:sterol desaturase/sphingolipid hydroxylase (fatty acid hydroxylase superfamily)